MENISDCIFLWKNKECMHKEKIGYRSLISADSVVLLKVVGWVMWMAGVAKVAEVYLEIRKSLEDQVRVSVCSPLVLICTVICLPFSKPLKRFGVKTNVCCVMLCNSGLNSQQNVQVFIACRVWLVKCLVLLLDHICYQSACISE